MSKKSNKSTYKPFEAIPIEWLKNQAIHYRAEAERNPIEFREYRRMAWACELVREIWGEQHNQQPTTKELNL